MPRFSTTDAGFPLDAYDLIIDVRSPSEYAEDHIEGAINLPVLSDAQRQKIGILYKKAAFEASRQGAAMVSENISRFLNHELAEIPYSAKILTYCFRGGQRSGALTHILSSIGWETHQLKGGYKAYRSRIIAETERFFEQSNLHVIAGYTGSGKTRILHSLAKFGAQVIDLESLANHKGSLFGSPNLGPQPSQKRFENRIHRTILQLDPLQPIFVEAESNRIGELFCPPALWKAMKAAKVIELETPFHSRVQCVLEDYQHYLEHPDEIIILLERLKKLRGAKLVASWLDLAKQKQWDQFVASLLKEHYDLAYKKSGKDGSAFSLPSKKQLIAGHTSDHFDAAAQQIIAC